MFCYIAFWRIAQKMVEIIKDFIKGFKEGQNEFKESIGSVINFIALTLLYFIGVGITYIFLNLFRKNLLDLKLDKSSGSYWNDLNLGIKKREDYLKQF